MSGGFLSGCRIRGKGGAGVQISHLSFVDDIVVSCEASQDQMVYLGWLIMWFKVISRLRIKLDKRELLPMGRVENLEHLVLRAWLYGRRSPFLLGPSFRCLV